MKVLVHSAFLLLLSTMVADSAVRVEVLNFETRTLRVVYEIEDTLLGNQIFLFPTAGFIHDDRMGDFEVESVFDTTTSEELNYSVSRLDETNYPRLRINYREPVREGIRKILRIAVKLNAPASDVGIDEARRHFLSFETSHPFELVVPENHFLVYCNQPVRVFEKEGEIILQNNEQKNRLFVIKTRPMK